jgi:hypothetical protein
MTEASHETDSAAVPERELVDKPPFGHFLPLRITCKVRPRATGERDRAWVRNAEYRRPGVERTSFGWLLLAPCWDFALPPREVPPRITCCCAADLAPWGQIRHAHAWDQRICNPWDGIPASSGDASSAGIRVGEPLQQVRVGTTPASAATAITRRVDHENASSLDFESPRAQPVHRYTLHVQRHVPCHGTPPQQLARH